MRRQQTETTAPAKHMARLGENPITLRLPAELRARLDALVPQIGNRSGVLRLAVLEGLKVLERRYAKAQR